MLVLSLSPGAGLIFCQDCSGPRAKALDCDRSDHRAKPASDILHPCWPSHSFFVMEYRNLYVQRIGAARTIAAIVVRLPLCLWLLDYVPDWLVYQRCYVVRASR